MRRQRIAAGVVVVGLLDDLAACLVERDLFAERGRDAAADEREGVHVLQLPARAEGGLPCSPHRDVRVATQRSLLHLRVGDAELDDGLAEQLQEPPGLLGGAQIGARDDLDERGSAAVEVDERAAGADDPAAGAADVHGLGRVLLQMGTDDADLELALLTGDDEAAVHAERPLRRPR